MVEVSVGRRCQLQGAEANIVQGLIVNAEGLIRVLHELVDRESGVVGLHHGVGHLRGRHDAEGVHDAVGVLLADLADEQRAHPRACTPTQRVGELEALQAVAVLRLLPHHVQDRVDQLSSLGVVTLGPVISCSTLTCLFCLKTNHVGQHTWLAYFTKG